MNKTPVNPFDSLKADVMTKVNAATTKLTTAQPGQLAPSVQYLGLPFTEMWKPKFISLPGKIFFVVFMILLIIELVVEMSIYNKNRAAFKSANMATSFWVRYFVAAALAVVSIMLYMLVIHVTWFAGYRYLAWFMLFVPFLYYIGVIFAARSAAAVLSAIKGDAAVAWFRQRFIRIPTGGN